MSDLEIKRITVVSPHLHWDTNVQSLMDLSHHVFHQVATLPEVLAQLQNDHYKPNLILFDLETLCNIEGISVFEISNMIDITSRVCANAQAPIIAVLVDAHSDPTCLQQILDTDVRGIVPRSDWLGMNDTLEALHQLLMGKHYLPKKILSHFTKPTKTKLAKNMTDLTPRQTQVLHLIQTRGASNKVIARSLKISESTVKVHISSILKKYSVRNRTQLALCGAKGKL